MAKNSIRNINSIIGVRSEGSDVMQTGVLNFSKNFSIENDLGITNIDVTNSNNIPFSIDNAEASEFGSNIAKTFKSITKYKKYNLNFTGTVAKNKGYISDIVDFDSSAVLPDQFNPVSSEWEMQIPIYVKGTSSSPTVLLGCLDDYTGINLVLNTDNTFTLNIGDGQNWVYTTTSVSSVYVPNTLVKLRIGYDRSRYFVDVNIAGTAWNNIISTSYSIPVMSYTISIGRMANSAVLGTLCGINLRDAYLRVGDSIVWEGLSEVNSTDSYDYTYQNLLCLPCTMTTTDGRTRTLEDTFEIDLQPKDSTIADNVCGIFRNVETGEAKLFEHRIGSHTYVTKMPAGYLFANNVGYNEETGECYNFTESAYAYTTNSILFANTMYNLTLQVVFKLDQLRESATTLIDTDSSQGITISISDSNKLKAYVSSTGQNLDIFNDVEGITTLQADTKYYVRYTFDGYIHRLLLSTTGKFQGEETVECETANTLRPSSCIEYFGSSPDTSSTSYLLGTIYLNESFISIDQTMHSPYFVVPGIFKYNAASRYTTGTDMLWVDFSKSPADVKIFAPGEGFVIDNDWVYLGEIKIADQSSVGNPLLPRFNSCPYKHNLIEHYTNGFFSYELYSDGMLEQRGYSVENVFIALMMPYPEGLYSVSLAANEVWDNSNITISGYGATGFHINIGPNQVGGSYAWWTTKGYALYIPQT